MQNFKSITKMQRGMITCNGVQTQVITEGRWVEENNLAHNSKHIVLVIPGNPGIPQFYEKFIKTVNTKLPSEVPVWVIGHAGHVQPSIEIAMPDNVYWDQHYGLIGQIQHKIDFIKTYVPKDAKLYLIGHSIGSWVILNMLKDDSIRDRIARCYLLFPTIEHMAESPNGQFMLRFVLHISSILIFLSWIFTLFPSFLQIFLIRIFGIFIGYTSEHTQAILLLLNPNVLGRVFGLVKEELQYVKERDDDVIGNHKDKLWIYYGGHDGWVPYDYYLKLKNKHPDINAQVCKRGFNHAFVLKDSVGVGHIVGDLINEEIRKTPN